MMPPRSAQARDAPVARAQIEARRAFDPAQPGGRLQHERVGEGVVVCGLGQPGLHLAETKGKELLCYFPWQRPQRQQARDAARRPARKLSQRLGPVLSLGQPRECVGRLGRLSRI